LAFVTQKLRIFRADFPILPVGAAICRPLTANGRKRHRRADGSNGFCANHIKNNADLL